MCRSTRPHEPAAALGTQRARLLPVMGGQARVKPICQQPLPLEGSYVAIHLDQIQLSCKGRHGVQSHEVLHKGKTYPEYQIL